MTPVEREDQRDKLILYLVCKELVPWTVEEVGRELNSPNDVIDGVGRFARAAERATRRYPACSVGRMRISLTLTCGGWEAA
jgi:hypothetical protein